MYQRSRHISDSTPKPGRIVLTGDEDDRKNGWKLARIDSLVSDFDGGIRTVRLTVRNGTTVERSIRCLYPLELDD